MPESNTKHLDYYPPGWTEDIFSDTAHQEESIIKWRYDDDGTIAVKLQPEDGDRYRITTTSGINHNEEIKTLTSQTSPTYKQALQTVEFVLYSMNGAVKRREGNNPQFHGERR